jgi:hypothetical protein
MPTVLGLLGGAVVCPLTCGRTGVVPCVDVFGMFTGGIGTSVTGGGEPAGAVAVPGAVCACAI